MNLFWEFSLEYYAKAGIKDACLMLQDEYGADVNVVLYALWLARQRRSLNVPALLEDNHLAAKQAVVSEVRACRRSQRDRDRQLYEQLKEEELQAERGVQDVLFEQVGSFSSLSVHNSVELAWKNLEGCLKSAITIQLGENKSDEEKINQAITVLIESLGWQ